MKNVYKIIFLMLLIDCDAAFNIAFAQDASIRNDSVYSEVLHEQRRIRIYIPEEYQPGSNEKYNVVYLLDGETHFDDFLYICRFAKNQKFIPPLILVGVSNNYDKDGSTRDRDFLPERTTANSKGGGADNFITFLKNELVPYINAKLPTTGDNMLFGHSLGGLFTLYVLLKEPDLFESYFCSDPAFPWNNRRVITMAEGAFKDSPELNKTLWIVGVEETYRNVGIARMDTVLHFMAPHGLRWKTSIYPNENHMSVRLKGIYDGLKYVYDGYDATKKVEFHPNNGSLLEGKPAPIFLNGTFPDVHYTTNGSEPDTSSARAPQMIEISAPAKVTMKWLGENKKYFTAAHGDFEVSNVWPALQDVKEIKSGGMQYSYYEGRWEQLPDFTALKAVKTGIADNAFSFEKLSADSNFACVFEGYLKIDTEGYYTFAVCSSDGSRLFINDRAIINNDGRHGSDWYKSYVVPLQKGFYPIRLEYFQRTGTRRLDMICLLPDTHETVKLTFGMMYYK